MGKDDKKFNLEELAKKHKVRKIREIELRDEDNELLEVVLMKPINRSVFSAISKFINDDPIRAVEVAVQNLCVSDNKDKVLNDDEMLIAMAAPIGDMAMTVSGTLKKK